MKSITFILLTVLTVEAHAQNLFPAKLNNCVTKKFCLDCGDIKAGYDQIAFQKLVDHLSKVLKLEGIAGMIKIQVLIDSTGKACVLSHTDQHNTPITLEIVKELNNFNQWTPAITNNVKEDLSSINLVIKIQDNIVSAGIERIDIAAFKKSFDRPQNPEIYNKKYKYKNKNLDKYKITVWNTANSNLPNNMNDHMAIDKDGIIWLTIDEGLVRFDGSSFFNAEPNIADKREYYYAIVSDNDNVKWVRGIKDIYSFDNKSWTKHDSAEIGISNAYAIINDSKKDELFFCSGKGLTIYKHGKWTTLNKSNLINLPSNNVIFAKRDAKNRIWIGTDSGTAVIDENNQITNFENTKNVLRGKRITSMDEDENGNLYFSLYESDRKDKQKVNNDEGIAVGYADGTFKQFTSDNSGMPFNHATCVCYDKIEKVLWISTDRAGLVRFDLKDGWENYHNRNCAIPTSYISTMEFDSNGNLFLATRQGLVKIERK